MKSSGEEYAVADRRDADQELETWSVQRKMAHWNLGGMLQLRPLLNSPPVSLGHRLDSRSKGVTGDQEIRGRPEIRDVGSTE